ncbi:ABC transporter ATP-binding protein [Cellulomonas soli]|uniref:ABC transporter ATP-binding protein n=1 Tax=Cellulomonas soli TaxID=931535 RepID=UPI003F859BD4
MTDEPTGTGLGLHDVVVRYTGDGSRHGGAGTTAVDGVSLHVGTGEVVALLGPSGCGKSSLLRAVAGLEPLAGGQVSWDGVSVTDMPVHRRGFGLMFQDGQLFEHRDVAGNVAFGLHAGGGGRRRTARTVRDARVAELLAVVGLTGYGDRPVATLSGGERQRVALARALAPRPRLLLLDEPLSALDRALRERLADDLRAALVATGTTALFVTHDQDEAFAVADRVAVMDAGRLRQVDTPGALWRHPATRQVAEFLGYEAFVPADPVRSAGPEVDEVVHVATEAGCAGDPTALLALAPGALVVTERTHGPRGDGPALKGTVIRVVARRGRAEVQVEVDGLGALTAVAALGAEPHVGMVVALAVDPTAVAFVPADERVRLHAAGGRATVEGQVTTHADVR